MNLDIQNNADIDTELMNRVYRGDESAFNQLMERYYKMVYYICLKYLKQKEEAQDATQEIFWKVWKNINQCMDNRYFICWLRTIANHHCIDILRRNKSRISREISLDTFDNSENLAVSEKDNKVINKKIALEYLLRLVQQLPEPQKEVFQKRLEGKTVQEIANELQCPIGTVLSRFSLAKRKIFEYMKEADLKFEDF